MPSEPPSDPVGASNPSEWPTSSSSWFREAFQDDYPLLYAARTVAQARVEVDCVVAALEISGRDRVLDLCCGYGRHLERFAELDIPTVGVDLSRQLLAAHTRRADDRRHARSSLVRADMRALPFHECFDVVVNFFTSFGYFEAEEDHAKAARALAGALKPEGRFSMDLMNAEAAIRTLSAHSERRVEPFDIVERRRYDAGRKRIEKYTELRYRPSDSEALNRDRRNRSYHESVRVFSRSEITDLLERAGLEIERVLGDFTGAPYHSDSPRLILLGRKPRS